MSRITLIAAVASNGVIGRDGGLPWHLPADLRHFKRHTVGHPIVMGRRTFKSIGRALPGRSNIVVTRDPTFLAQGCQVAHSLDDALALCAAAAEVFIIGGASLYAEALPRASRLLLTLLDDPFAGDVTFPDFDRAQWREVEREIHEADADNPHRFAFVRLERRTPATD